MTRICAWPTTWKGHFGKYSQKYKAEERRIINKTLQRARRRDEFDADDSEAQSFDRIFGASAGWDLCDPDGTAVPFTKDNALTVLRKAPWFVPELQKAIEGHDSFFKRGSAS